MAFLRSSAIVALRSRSLATIAPVSRIVRDAPAKFPIAAALTRPAVSIRWHSNPVAGAKVYEFSQIQQLSEAPSAERIIIDVREPFEYEEGFIPSAINLPIKSQPDALFLPAEEFEDRFGFQKPTADTEVIFYCKSGVRSSAAAQLARQVGYKNVAEYRGSWLDWAKNGGSAAKP